MKSVFLFDSQLTQPAVLEAFKDFILTAEPVSEPDVLFRWGNLKGDDNAAKIVLNRKDPLRQCLDTANTFEVLRINRVRRPRFVTPRPETPYPLIGKFFSLAQGLKNEVIVADFAEALGKKADYFVECINTVKKYNVFIFDLKIFFVTKKVPVKTSTDVNPNPQWNYEEIPADLDTDTQKVCQLAQRTAHVLGLDFCVVHAGVDARGRPVILEVNPTPDLPPRALGIFRQLVSRHINRQKRRAVRLKKKALPGPPGKNVVLRTASVDRKPKRGLPVHPAQLPPQGPKAIPRTDVILGADPEFVLRDSITGKLVYPSEYISKEGRFGYDDRSENREGLFFPLAEVRPSPCCCPLELTEKIRQVMASGLSLIPPQIEWLAGSEHFERYQIGGHIHFSSIKLNSRFLRVLDNYLGIPTMLLEEPVSAARRRKHYGMIGSIRVKPHGGFEYRTPASWLISPEITRACLCLAKIAALEYGSLKKDCLLNPEMQKAFYLCKKHLFYDIFEEIWTDITKTASYGTYEKYLGVIPAIIRSQSHWDDTLDLRKTWGLLPTRQ